MAAGKREAGAMNNERAPWPGHVLRGEPLARHVTFRVGGPARFLAVPADARQARAVLETARARECPVFVLGRGSNVLFADAGYRGLVLKTPGLAGLSLRAGGVLAAGGGTSLAALLGFCLREGCAGLEFLAGIPGTVGGALRMNAGAWGRAVSETVLEVTVLDDHLRPVVLPVAALSFGYRTSSLGSFPLILGASFRVAPGADPRQLRAVIREQLRARRRKQPSGQPSAGSVFRNPPGDSAGRLIEAAGCKGWREGGAEVSRQHANFIVNCSGATARDIVRLAARVRSRVRAVSGRRLALEIRLVRAG